MGNTKNYACELCGKKLEISGENSDVPDCCDQPMKMLALPVCEASSTAEHSRFDDTIEPCDDGRAG